MPLPRLLRVLPSLLVLAAPAGAEIVERIVAKVNGDIITQTEFEARQVAAVQMARVEPRQIEAFLRANNARLLQEAIDELLLAQRAADLNMRLRPEYIKEVIEGIKKENNLASDEQLQEQLRREGMSLDDLKRNIERSILRRQVLSRELEPKLAVTDADARADYDARKQEYVRAPAVKLQEILVPPAGGETRAREIVARARVGEDFAALARTYSASHTGAEGGELGWLAKGEMNAQIEKVAFDLEPGQVSDPVRVGSSFLILKLVEARAGHTTPFEEVKEEIKKRLGQERGNREYEAYLAGLRKSAIVNVMVREVPLEVTAPAAPTGILEGLAGSPDSAARPAAPAGPEEEITTTPQAAPERVAPPALPGQPSPEPDAEKKDESKPSPPPS
jgi:parvulin-like peptidyl-prolyl isomerase